jgi:hypothetical protein
LRSWNTKWNEFTDFPQVEDISPPVATAFPQSNQLKVGAHARISIITRGMSEIRG